MIEQYQHKSIAVYSTMASIVTALLIWIAGYPRSPAETRART